MLRKSACGMNRNVFCGAVWVHPIEGTKKAKNAAAANRNMCVKEIMLPCWALLVLANLRDPYQGRQCKSWAAHSPPPRGGGLGWGLTGLAAIAKLRQLFRY